MSVVWQPAQTAPQDLEGVAIAGFLTCCHVGALIVTVAGRFKGNWVLPNTDHAITITHWMSLPAHPARPLQ